MYLSYPCHSLFRGAAMGPHPTQEYLMSPKDMTQSIMRRKPIDDIEEENKHSGLFKSLGLWQLTAIGVGGIIGVGIFSLAGLVAAGSGDNPGVGPAVLFSSAAVLMAS